jgi:hypothetical protein
MGMKSKFRYIIVAMIVAAACAVGSTRAQAQASNYAFYPKEDKPKVHMEWGVGVGATYTGMTEISVPIVDLKPRFSIAGHFDMAVCIGRNFAIETEIHYEGGSINVATPNDSHKVQTRTLDIPVLLSLRLASDVIRINAGPLFTVMSNAQYTDNSETMFFGPTSPTWNVAAGIGIGLGRHFLIEARYVYPLKRCINQFEGVEFTTRAYRVTAGVTLLF